MSLKKQINKINDMFNKHIENDVIKLTGNTLDQLVERNPIDTSFSGANWVPSIGTPFITKIDPLERSVSNAITSKSVQRNAMRVIRSTYRLASGNVFITNNVPYILDLEFRGTSLQAPNGFVRQSIDTAVNIT